MTKPQLTATATTGDWMPEHCLPPKTNHDDYSFSPLSLSYTSSSEATDDVALPLPPSRLLRHHTLPWSISSDHATLNHKANIIGISSKNLERDGKILDDFDERAMSPNSVSAFPPSSLAVLPSRRRPRTTGVDVDNDDNNDSSATIVEKMETYLPLCGSASTSVDANTQGGGADGMMGDSNRNNAELSTRYKEGREMTVLRGEYGQQLERRQQQQQIEGGHKAPTTATESDLSQLSSGMEFLAMVTCGLLNQSVTPTKEGA